MPKQFGLQPSPSNMTASQNPPKAAVFLSYSRTDASFLARLSAALEMRGYTPIYDRSERLHHDPDLLLTAQDEWWGALKAMIAASDVMVFVVTPDSARSPVCDDEIAHAKSLGKRVVAILRRDIDFNTAPERLRTLNVLIDFRADDDAAFLAALDALSVQLNIDIEWHRRGARLARLADQWNKDGRPAGQLLRAGAIAEADAWAARRPRDAPEPGPLLLAFLDSARDLETKSLNNLRRRIGVAFVPPSDQSFREGNFDRTLRLILAAAILSNDPNFELTPELPAFVAPSCLRLRLRAMFSHDSMLTTLALSPKEPYIVIGSSDCCISVRNIEDGSLVALLTGHNEGINCAKFSRDGSYLATSSGDRWISRDDSVCIWSTATWTKIAKFECYQLVKWCDVTSDGRFCFAVDHLNAATVFSVNLRRKLIEVTINGSMSGDRSDEPCPVILIDAHKLFIAINDRGGVFFRLNDQEAVELEIRDSSQIRLVSASSDQKLLACFHGGGRIRLLSSDELKEVNSFRTKIQEPDNIKFISGDNRILVTTLSEFEIFNIADGSAEGSGTLNGERTAGDGLSVVPAPMGDRAIVREKNGDWALIDSNSGREIHREKGHAELLDYVYIAFSRDGRTFALSSKSGNCEVRASATGQLVSSLVGHKAEVRGIAFLDDHSKVITISNDWTGRIWTTGRMRPDIEVVERAAQQIIWMGETLVAIGPHGAVDFLDDRSRKTTILPNATQQVSAVSFGRQKLHTIDPRGVCRSYLLSEGSLRFAHALSLKLHPKWPTIGGAAFSPDANLVAVWPSEHGAGTAKEYECVVDVFELKTGRRLVRVSHQDCITSASFSLDGCKLITTSGAFVDLSSLAYRWDDSVRMWDARSGEEIAAFQGHKFIVCNACQLENDRLVSASEDGEIKFWNIEGAFEMESLNIGKKWRIIGISPDQSVIFGVDAEGGGHFFSISERRYIGPLSDVTSGIASFCFRQSDGCLALRCIDDTIWIVPLEPIQTCADVRKLAVAVALARNGVGVTTPYELRDDLLLAEAPKDLHEAALKQWPWLVRDVEDASAVY
jgi:WD40 repeat protein